MTILRKNIWLLFVGGVAFAASVVLNATELVPVSSPPPNVLLILADDLRPLLGCYGDKLAKTPNIDRLASRSLRFDRAYATYPICGPSRASFLSGLRPLTSHYYGWESVPNVTQLPAWFRQHGYYTADFGKVYHTNRLAFPKMGERPGQKIGITLNPLGCWDESDPCVTAEDTDGYGYAYSTTLGVENKALSQYVAVRGDISPNNVKGAWQWMEWAELTLPDERTGDGLLVRHASAAIKKAVAAKTPFFVAAGLRRPHQLLAAPKPYFDLYQEKDMPGLPKEPPEHVAALSQLALTYPKKFAYQIYSDDDRRRLERAYRANIAFVDAQIGELLRTLDQQDLWKNTVVILTTDHGWHLGEHGGLANKHTLFEEATRVPFLVFSPGAKGQGSSSGYPVELVDLFPTLVDLCGLPMPEGLDGQSLKPLIDGEEKVLKRAGAISIVRRVVSASDSEADEEGEKPAPKTPRRAVNGISLRTPGWRYTEWDGGKLGAELYDESADPQECRNLAEDHAHAVIRSDLKQKLAATIHPGA